MDQASACLRKKAMPSAHSGIAEDIILDSGASAHHLKHCLHFTSLKSLLSTIFGANSSSIQIIGKGPAVIPLATGPIEISLAYFVPDLSNSLLPLTHYV
jgi:hypothetical protein